MQKVSSVEASENSLAEARQRIEKMMNKRNSEEYDFDGRLQEAVQEVRKKEEEAYANHKGQKLLSSIELYSLRYNTGVAGNNLTIISQ